MIVAEWCALWSDRRAHVRFLHDEYMSWYSSFHLDNPMIFREVGAASSVQQW